MPRPKRSRVASARAAAHPSTSTAQSSRPPLAAKRNAPNSKIPATTSDDACDSGDRGNERKRKRDPARGTTTRSYSAALEASGDRRDSAMSQVEKLSSTTLGGASDAQSPPVEVSRRESSAVADGVQTGRRVTDASGLELDDDLFAALDDSLDDPQDEDDTQARTGQYSTDTSSFNVSLFKRRPRASSVARDTSIRPSSRGGATTPLSSTFSFGLFKRRARAPSILGTAQKERSYRRAESSQASQASGDEAEDEDDFVPDAAGTPLDAAPPSISGETDASGGQSPVVATRKRKSQEAHGNNKRRSLEGGEELHQSIEVDSSPLGSVRRCTTPDRLPTPDLDDPAMAPPLSSSPSDASPVAWPSLDTLAHRVYPPSRARKTPEPSDDISDLSSPPSLTHSPNYNVPTMKTRQKAREASPKWTTKDLASLLPRRRARARSNDPFAADPDGEFDTTGLGQDEDELSYMDTRPARKRTTRKKESQSAKTRQRTYGRNVDQDEEDEGGDGLEEDDEAGENDVEEGLTSDELARAAHKFKEVDQWEMSFEEVTESSSPVKDAR